MSQDDDDAGIPEIPQGGPGNENPNNENEEVNNNLDDVDAEEQPVDPVEGDEQPILEQAEQPEQQEPPPEPEEDEETKRLRLEREELERKEQEEREERERIAREEAEAKLKEELGKFSELLKGGVGQLGKTADGTSFAYLRMILAEKELEKIYDTIGCYTHLRYLDVSQNKLTDLSSISSLKYLVSINASKNEIPNLTVFKSKVAFPYLQYLNMSTNKLTQLESVQLPRLRRLNLTENEIVSCEEFIGHPALEILELRKNKLKNTNGVSLMPQLVELYLAENEITDFRALTGLPKLKRLNLRKNNLTKIKTPVPELPGLVHINLRENQLSKFEDFKKLARIKNITSINILANPIADEFGDGFKTQVLMYYQYFTKLNKSDVTPEDIVEANRALEELEEKKRQEEAERLANEEALRTQQEQDQAAKENGNAEDAQE